MDLVKLADESIQDAIDYNKELGGSMTTDQEYWFYTGYQFGVEKHHKTDIEKACKWMYKHLTINCKEGDCETIEEFRKAMEG